MVKRSGEIVLPTRNGSDDIKLIYLSIGYAAQKWEHLEHRLFDLFSAMASNDWLVDTQTYSALSSFRGRSEMIARLCEYRFCDDPVYLKRCISMIERVRKLSQRRNDIVHGQTSNMSVNPGRDGEPPKFQGFYLTNSLYGSSIFVRQSNRAFWYNHDDIIGFAKAFEKCRHDLNDLVDDCRAQINRPLNSGHAQN